MRASKQCMAEDGTFRRAFTSIVIECIKSELINGIISAAYKILGDAEGS